MLQLRLIGYVRWKERHTCECPCGAVGTLEPVRWSLGLMPGPPQGISPPSVGSNPTAPVSPPPVKYAGDSRCLPEREASRGSLPPTM